jgi:NhaP-type Na+/H+ or K+/H+ antiporter
VEFPQLLPVVGALLTAAAAPSGWLRRVVLSISVLSLLTGMAFAWAGLLRTDPANEDLFVLIEFALLLTLFSDGLLVERELLRREWANPRGPWSPPCRSRSWPSRSSPSSC